MRGLGRFKNSQQKKSVTSSLMLKAGTLLITCVIQRVGMLLVEPYNYVTGVLRVSSLSP